MPISSQDVMGMMSSQQAMFAGNAAFAQQIGGVYGTNSPQSFGQAGWGAQSVGPFSYSNAGGIGAAAVGTMGSALPGIAGGVAMGAGMLGGAASIIDPFTMVPKAFAHGAGIGGMGLGGLGAMASTFAASPMAGLGMVGKGLLAGSAAALPYMAVGAGMEYVGGQMYQGAQNLTQVESVMGRQGPFYGQPGVRRGGGMGRGQIQDIVGILHEVTGDPDLNATMQDLTRLAGKAQQMGMLTGVMNAADFKSKFTKIVSQVKNIAQIMGTSLDEAAPLLGQMRQMGLWRTSDVMGTAYSLQQVGAQAAPHLLGSMQAGAQMAWQQGGSLSSGAAIGRQAFMQVQAATQAGVLSNEAITELTGGVGGVEGQRMVSGSLTRGVSGFSQSSMGRLMMAGLGETRGGKFTGGINTERLERFMSGGIGVGDLQRLGARQSGTREGAASFKVKSGQIGQEMMAQGGIEAVASAISRVMEKSGYGDSSEEIRNIFIQKMMGVNDRDAELWRNMIDELPKIEQERTRKARDAVEDSFRRLDSRQNRSWQGFKESLSQMGRQAISRPIQEFGERMSTGISGRVDRLSDWWFGRQQRLQISQAERMRTLMSGNPTTLEDMGMGGKTIDLDTPFAEQMRRDPAAFMRGTGLWTRKGEFEAAGATTTADMQRVARRSLMRAQNATFSSLGYEGTEAQQQHMSSIQNRLQAMMIDPRMANELRRAREESGGNESLYIKRVVGLLKRDNQAARAMGELAGGDISRETDMLAIAQQKGGFSGAELAIQTGRQAQGMVAAWDVKDPESLTRAMDESYEVMDKDLKDASNTGWRMAGRGLLKAAGASIGAAFGAALGPVAMAAGMAAGRGLGGVAAEALFDESDLPSLKEAVSNKEWGDDMLRWVEAGMPGTMEGNRFIEALLKKDPSAVKMHQRLSKMDPNKIPKWSSDLRKLRGAAIWSEELERRGGFAETELGRMDRLTTLNVGKDSQDQYKKVLEAYRDKRTDAGELAARAAEELSDRPEDLEALSRQGAIGRQISALARLQKFGSRGGKVGTKAFTKEFDVMSMRGGLGFRLEDLMKSEYGDEIRGKLQSGGLVDEGERARIAEIAKLISTRVGPQEKRKEVGEQEKLYNLLTSYASAHEKFVWAVTGAIGTIDKKDVQEIKDQIRKMSDARNTNAPGKV